MCRENLISELFDLSVMGMVIRGCFVLQERFPDHAHFFRALVPKPELFTHVHCAVA